MKIRRVVTGHDEDGKAVVKWDSELESVSGRPGFYRSEMWATKQLPPVLTDEIIFVTADGSRGVKGHIKEGMKVLADRGEKIDHAHFVGCTFMMMLSAEATKPYNIPTIVSLNTLMVDGTGMCGVCRVLVDGNTKFACVDGPDFDGHLINWDNVFQRKKAYEGEENLAYQFHKCRVDGAMTKDAKSQEAV